ncbi:MAG: acyl-CoA dehydrogenase [Acidimicrobiia bacterium]
MFADPPEVTRHPKLAGARGIAPQLALDADRVEHAGVDRGRLDRLAAAGLHAVMAPAELGGVPAPVYRRIAEVLAGGDPTTWFVWFQHNPVCRLVAGSDNEALRGRWLEALSRGTTQTAVAFSHLRRTGRPLEAVRTEHGWELTGRAAWCTGWGLLDTVLVGAVTDEADERVLMFLVPLAEGNGLTPSPEMALTALAGSRTVELRFDGYAVSDGDVVSLQGREAWTEADAVLSANVQPSTFGIAEAALEGLHYQDPDAAEILGWEIARCRAEAYRLIDEVPAEEELDRRLAVRAEALLRTVDITSAYVASLGGMAMESGNDAERLARAALFHLVFAQSAAVRDATLNAFSTTSRMIL